MAVNDCATVSAMPPRTCLSNDSQRLSRIVSLEY